MEILASYNYMEIGPLTHSPSDSGEHNGEVLILTST
jgi:hypothetical protein